MCLFHKWGKWREPQALPFVKIKGEKDRKYGPLFQCRNCLKCNRLEIRGVKLNIFE